MSNKIKYCILLCLCLVLFIAAKNSTSNFLAKISILSNVIRLVDRYYVEDVEMDEGKKEGKAGSAP